MSVLDFIDEIVEEAFDLGYQQAVEDYEDEYDFEDDDELEYEDDEDDDEDYDVE